MTTMNRKPLMYLRQRQRDRNVQQPRDFIPCREPRRNPICVQSSACLVAEDAAGEFLAVVQQVDSERIDREERAIIYMAQCTNRKLLRTEKSDTSSERTSSEAAMGQ